MSASREPIAPIIRASIVTPSDSIVLPKTRGIYIGGAGNLAVRMSSGNIVTFTAPAVGTVLNLEVDQVLATGTTATSLLALY